jgi:hypothetical protein
MHIEVNEDNVAPWNLKGFPGSLWLPPTGPDPVSREEEPANSGKKEVTTATG